MVDRDPLSAARSLARAGRRERGEHRMRRRRLLSVVGIGQAADLPIPRARRRPDLHPTLGESQQPSAASSGASVVFPFLAARVQAVFAQ